jgi:hypothetical protein
VRRRAIRIVPAVLCALGAAAPGPAQDTPLPLPPAPVRMIVPDVAAFDAALEGSFRRTLTGAPAEGDPLVGAWRQTPVGTKLEAQWAALAHDLSWTWTDIQKLKPRALGLALLSAGELEAVLVLETPLSTMPFPPAGTSKSHAGAPYNVVARGAGDGRLDARRLGLAWARRGAHLLLATSERALLLALDEAAAGRGVTAPLPGLASLELDTAALARDRYFRREFLFDASAQGRVVAALRRENDALVEVREGGSASGEPPAFLFEPGRSVAAGWETDGALLFPALRTGLLEAVPDPAERPVPPVTALPSARAAVEDRYLVDFRKPARGPESKWEEGDLAVLRSLVAKRASGGWGFTVLPDGERALVVPCPAAEQRDLEAALRKTIERRAGPAAVTTGDVREIRVGPGLVALAVKKTGDFVWIGSSAAALAGAAAPRPADPVLRWARVDLAAARAESDRWARAEGPAAPERLRPFSDRVLGLLGWMPRTRSIVVERRRADAGWSERVVFSAE